MYIIVVYAVLFLIDVLWWWRIDRLLRLTGVPARELLRHLCAIFAVVQLGTLSVVMLNYFIAYSTGIAAGEWYIPTFIAGLAYVWHLVILPPVILVWAAARVWRGLAWGLQRLRADRDTSRGVDAVQEPPAPGGMAGRPMTRRAVLAAFGAAPPAIAVAVTAVAFPRASRFRLNRMTVHWPDLPEQLDGVTIAHVSDMHVGYFTSDELLTDIVDSVNSLDADLVALTGDLVNRSLRDLPKAAEMVHSFRSRHGSVMCEGNHDLLQNPQLFYRQSLRMNLPLLVNETHTLRINGYPVQLLSQRWGSPRSSRHPEQDRSDRGIYASAKELFEHRDHDAFPILLAHHPHAFDAAIDEQIPLMLSGHTHGGQIHFRDQLGFGPWMYRYWSGAYRSERSVCIVSNGTGNWFPIRVNAPAEIVHVTLRRGALV